MTHFLTNITATEFLLFTFLHSFSFFIYLSKNINEINDNEINLYNNWYLLIKNIYTYFLIMMKFFLFIFVWFLNLFLYCTHTHTHTHLSMILPDACMLFTCMCPQCLDVSCLWPWLVESVHMVMRLAPTMSVFRVCSRTNYLSRWWSRNIQTQCSLGIHRLVRSLYVVEP